MRAKSILGNEPLWKMLDREIELQDAMESLINTSALIRI
jgi:hypothetical protein